MDKVFTMAEQIANYYRERIISGELLKGDKIESEERAALRFNVSRMTVRKAFKMLESAGLVGVTAGRARIVTGNKGSYDKECGSFWQYGGKKIALVIPDDREFLTEIKKCLQTRLELLNWKLYVFYNDNEHVEYNSFLKAGENAIDGMIIIPSRTRGNISRANYNLLKSMKIPFVLLGKPPRWLRCDATYVDDYYGSFLIMKKLSQDKCAAFAYIGDGDRDIVVNEDRRTGFEDFMEHKAEIKNYTDMLFDYRSPDFNEKLTDFVSRNISKKIGFNLYSGNLAGSIEKVMRAFNKTRGKDYEIYGFTENDLFNYDTKSCNIVHIPIITLIEGATEMLRTRFVSGDSENVTHKIYKAKIDD